MDAQQFSTTEALSPAKKLSANENVSPIRPDLRLARSCAEPRQNPKLTFNNKVIWIPAPQPASAPLWPGI